MKIRKGTWLRQLKNKRKNREYFYFLNPCKNKFQNISRRRRHHKILIITNILCSNALSHVKSCGEQ